MANETIVLLRSILYQAKKAESIDEIISAIEIMCSKDECSCSRTAACKSKGVKEVSLKARCVLDKISSCFLNCIFFLRTGIVFGRIVVMCV